jgi:hypothetical protein
VCGDRRGHTKTGIQFGYRLTGGFKSFSQNPLQIGSTAMLRSTRISVVTFGAMIVSGCATEAPIVPHWASNKSATQDQWLKDRYACYSETKQRISGAAVDASGGSSNSIVLPMCNEFNACLAARGYFRSDTAGLLYVPDGANVQCATVNQ